MYKSQFQTIDPCDWFSAPGSQMSPENSIKTHDATKMALVARATAGATGKRK